MIKTKEVRVCDNCKKEIEGHGIQTEGVPNEGCSTIRCGKHKSYDVDDADFCDLTCFTNYVADNFL